MGIFKLHAPFEPTGDQPQAIEHLVASRPGVSTLMGVTGSGKTFTMAQVIARQDKPVLILSPNKTLAAQLYEEFSLFFPENKVCYFVSYYDYYQPESYLPAQDIYIPKETKINAEIERLRIESAASMINRPDTIVIASVSCIYSLGNPEDYRDLALNVTVGQEISRSDLMRQLIFIQYVRNDMERTSGTFAVMGGALEVILPYQKEKLRIELEGSKISRIEWLSRTENKLVQELDCVTIFPAKYFVTTQEKRNSAIASIKAELEQYLPTMKNPIYRERLEQRVRHDLELLAERGSCPGVENYSVHFDGRTTGKAPYCLFDFFPDFLLMIDESHVAIPQLRGMYAGDRSRKQSLVEFGFRLPCAYDNRPLKFEETEKYFTDVVFVSATPGPYELEKSDTIVEQLMRPTGLLDPLVEVHPREDQISHLITQIQNTTHMGFRTLITVLTKKLAEELAHYLEEARIKACYLHSELKTPERTEILHKLRSGVFDCVVGVNLLREGLDLPEVALVAIMDADIESFLRDKRSLIQTIGRAARNANSKVILYADTITESMRSAMEETARRRHVQDTFNQQHGIIPTSVSREVTKSISPLTKAIMQASKNKRASGSADSAGGTGSPKSRKEILADIIEIELKMQECAQNFDFEEAIALRARWMELKKLV